MAQFSGAVKIGDLNDFIAPSQACVVSLQGQKQTASATAAGAKAAQKATEGLQLNARPSKRQHHQQQQQQQQPSTTNSDVALPSTPPPQQQQQQPTTGGFQQTVLAGDNQAVKVSLNDCLACSGCVTSAETVLLQAQSLKEFVARCDDPDAIVVVSISPQSRASLAALHGISPEEVHARLAHFLKFQLSVALVLDTSLGQALALSESAAEFVNRLTQARQLAAGGSKGAAASSSSSAAGQLPMLASACPGWVCYAEKTHGSYILPHIATTRSPQGILGSLVKQRLAAAKGWDPSHVYHVTVMPCYDKKLEASRDDFLLPGSSVSEVDSSLTTGELHELLEKYGQGDLKALPAGRGDNLLGLLMTAAQQQQQQGEQQGKQQQQQESLRVPEPVMHTQPGSSGGYADFIFTAAAAALYGLDLSPAAAAAAAAGANLANGSSTPSKLSSSSSGNTLPWRVLRNADMQELQLLDADGSTPLLCFALAYGFRNIQTIVRQIKTGRCPYHYVEVMACPSGCLNGGGQLKPPKGVSTAALVEQLERQYFRQQVAAAAAAGGEVCSTEQQQQRYRVAPGSIQLLQPASVVQQQQQQHEKQEQQEATRVAQVVPNCISSRSLAAVYDVVLQGQPGSDSLQQLLHTQYHKREKTVTSTISDW